MTDIEIRFGTHIYTVNYDKVWVDSVCECCGQRKDDVEKLAIEYIVRQQGMSDGKDIAPESKLGKKIIKQAKWETIGEEMCLDCRTEMSSGL